jgi:tetratricopeptide (TPR) repeat protein
MRATCVLVTFISLSAIAEESDFQRYYNAALRLHESLEYERALETLGSARKAASTLDEQARVNLAEGVVLADLNRLEEARAAFKAGLLLTPDAPLPLKVAPKVAAEVEALRARVKQELAPLLARQEAERRQAEAERLEAENKRRTAEAKAQEALRLELENKKAEADARAAEAARLLAEADAKLKEIERLEAERKQQALLELDRPLASDALTPDGAPPPLVTVNVAPPSKAPMALTWIFTGAALASAGVGIFFGLQAQSKTESARDAVYQDDASRLLQQAGSDATAADILYGTAGALALGAVISGIAWAAGMAPPPVGNTTSSSP